MSIIQKNFTEKGGESGTEIGIELPEILLVGIVITVEPIIYFIPALIDA